MSKSPYVGVTVSKFEGMMPSVIIKGLKLLGVEFIEVNRHIFADAEDVIANLGSIITAFHLPLIAEDGWDFSCLDHADDIETTLKNLQKNHKAMRIRHLVCHPPEPEAAKEPIQSSLDFLFENLKKTKLPVYLENVPKVPPHDFLNILQKAKRELGEQLWGMCFDAPHYFITGYDPIEEFKRYNGIVGCIHLSDCYPDRDVHIPFNSGGTLPVDEFLSQVRNSEFDGYITLEMRPHSLKEIQSYIDSYLKTLQFVNVKKYRRTKHRIMALRPIIKRFAS